MVTARRNEGSSPTRETPGAPRAHSKPPRAVPSKLNCTAVKASPEPKAGKPLTKTLRVAKRPRNECDFTKINSFVWKATAPLPCGCMQHPAHHLRIKYMQYPRPPGSKGDMRSLARRVPVMRKRGTSPALSGLPPLRCAPSLSIRAPPARQQSRVQLPGRAFLTL